jgi:hypothetical protein
MLDVDDTPLNHRIRRLIIHPSVESLHPDPESFPTEEPRIAKDEKKD